MLFPARLSAILPSNLSKKNRLYFARDFARYFASEFTREFTRDFTRGFASDFANSFVNDFARYFARYLARYFEHDFASDFAPYFVRDFARYLTCDFARYFKSDFARDFAYSFTRYFMSDFAHDFALSFAHDFTSITPEKLSPPTEIQSANELILREKAIGGKSRDAHKWADVLVARLTGEGLIALMTSVDQPDEDRLAYFHRRIQNSWLLNIWPGLDNTLGKEPHPDHLALYLALGWTQATTTWQWPATERWIALLSGKPPAHWLPRSQWHLCWLLYDPDDANHRQQLRDALVEGIGDKKRPGIAAELKKQFLDGEGD